MGNPGKKYAHARHNIGFRVVDRFTKQEKVEISKKGFSSLWAKEVVGEVKVLFALPQTFMNRSGEAVREVKDFYRVEEKDLMVVHDDIDLPLGRIKIDQDAGAAGHRGVESIIEVLGRKDFYRMRLGIGRPVLREEVEGYVLSPFAKEEQGIVEEMITKAAESLRRWIG